MWVAPYAGAWIETLAARASSFWTLSPPTRGRGLKLFISLRPRSSRPVAPYAGAWIETRPIRSRSSSVICRPLRGGVD